MSTSRSAEIFAGAYDPPERLWLAVHFSPSPSGRAAGLAFLKRKLLRKDRDPEVSEEAATAQREALAKYYAPAESVLDYLKAIRQPTLIVQGSNDVIVPTVNSYILQQNLPNAELIVYPDANHGSFYQYPELFVSDADHWSGHAIGRSIRRRLTPSREAVDCRLDEGGGQESERDGSADPTFGFAFARGERFDGLVGTGGQFVEPVMSAAKRVGEDRAPLQKPP